MFCEMEDLIKRDFTNYALSFQIQITPSIEQAA